jgi:hypothetical protein
MSQNKTQATKLRLSDFIGSIEDMQKRAVELPALIHALNVRSKTDGAESPLLKPGTPVSCSAP